MRSRRAWLALTFEGVAIVALLAALTGLTLRLPPLSWGGLALAVPAYFLCVYLARWPARQQGVAAGGAGPREGEPPPDPSGQQDRSPNEGPAGGHAA
jgi:hypothetical protein